MKAENPSEIIRQALFADENEEYRLPAEPDEGQTVTLRFRTARDNIDYVYYQEAGREEKLLTKMESDELFDYYEYKLTVADQTLRYHFHIVKGSEGCYYNRLGVCSEAQEDFDYLIVPGFHTPGWAKGAVMYQIFVDRFCNGDRDNDVLDCEYIYIGRPVHQVKDWDRNPSTMDVGCFYGGDLQGVWNKLDYLQSLGIEVIYFNPLFVSPSNHKYDTQDYDHIDPHYGKIVKDGGELVSEQASDNSNATKYGIRSADPANLEASDKFFAEFVAEVHRRGMRVIIDGVFNHCGSFNKWMDREQIYEKQGAYEPGAYVSADSPYRTFFKFNDQSSWPYNSQYDGWWGHDTLPKLNYEGSSKLYEYILNIGRKWVSPPYSADGWRLDVAADLGHTGEFNHQFWRDFRKAVKEANPDAIILAEHYGDARSWLMGDQWDTIMNYDAFMEPVTWFLTGMEKHSDEYNENLYGNGEAFFHSMFYHMSRMQTQSIQISMNELSNHDHSRFMTRSNRTIGRIGTAGPEAAEQGIHKGIFREAVLIQMTWPGAPTVYYGDETGLCGWTDPDNRRTYPWGKEDMELIEFHKYMIRLHKWSQALRRGSIKQLLAEHQLIGYGRFLGEEKCVIVVNNSHTERLVEIPVWEIGIKDEDRIVRVMKTNTEGYNVGLLVYKVTDGMVSLTMEAYSGILLVVHPLKEAGKVEEAIDF
ncbi:MAG: glycoside hydrolase family 13 protein [Hungatella sp.]|nr:glycoside hydrolase family 13 protein [Hungatella sp.]